jgi:hypothetical protein
VCLRNILALLAFGPYAALIVLAIGGAFVALFAAFAGLEQVKTIAGAVSGFCAITFFVLLLSPLGEILAGLPALAPQPAPPSAPSPPVAPRSTPSTGRTLLKWMGIVTAVWTGLFVCLWLPVAALYQHQVLRRPVVVATVTDHHVYDVQGKGGTTKTVRATVSFKRQSGADLVDCRLENYPMGYAGSSKAWATTLQLAVHPLSCNAPVELPLQTDFDDHVISFLFLLIVLLFMTVFIALVLQQNDREQQAAAARQTEV